MIQEKDYGRKEKALYFSMFNSMLGFAFLIWGSAFSFCFGPYKLCSRLWLLQICLLLDLAKSLTNGDWEECRGSEALRGPSSPFPPEALWILFFIVLIKVFLALLWNYFNNSGFYQFPSQRTVPIFLLFSDFLNTHGSWLNSI